MLPNLIRVSVLVVTLLKIAQISAQPFEGINAEYMKNITRYAKAAEMHNYLKESHDPCDNFYEFACGNYYRINPPTQAPLESDTFRTMAETFKRKIRTALRPNDTTDTLADVKVKNFFESCMHLAILRKTYGEKLKEIIDEFGRMPALEKPGSWLDSNFDWLKTVAEIAYKYQIGIILSYQIEADISKNTENRLYIRVQEFPSELVYSEDAFAEYRDKRKTEIANNLEKFFNLETLLAEETAQEIFEFEKLLNIRPTTTAEGSKSDDEDDDDFIFSLNHTTINEMHHKYYPDFDIKRLLNISLGYIPSVNVYDLIQYDADYIISAIKTTPKRIVANYIFYYLVEGFMLIKPKADTEHETVCIRTTKNHFANIIDNMVYRMYPNHQVEDDLHSMWQIIKATFESTLDSPKLLWMNEATRQYAKEKLYAMKMAINAYQQMDFNKELENLTLNKHDYVENIKSIFALNAVKTRAKLYQAPQPYDNSDMTVRSTYVVTENLIKIPVAMLQPYNLWSNSYPYAMMFATLGFLISHALVHGFDEEGRDFDKTGNNLNWWDKETNKYFQHRTACFSEQYQMYGLPEMDSQSENIADNGGIRLAYEAYLHWHVQSLKLRRNLDLEIMPRLNYTNKQLFFIGYGQLWCYSKQSSSDIHDNHVPNEFRVIGPLSNLEEFSEEFKCPSGSGMNPSKKCVIY